MTPFGSIYAQWVDSRPPPPSIAVTAEFWRLLAMYVHQNISHLHLPDEELCITRNTFPRRGFSGEIREERKIRSLRHELR